MTESLQVWIDQDLCTGDGLCVQYAPEVFEFDVDGLAYVKDGTATCCRGRAPGPTCRIAAAGRHRLGQGVPRAMHPRGTCGRRRRGRRPDAD